MAQMYASKCHKSPEDFLELMKKGGWLTAKEALEWGFVDEVTNYEEDAAPVMTDSIAADMASSGIPVPAGFATQQPSNIFARFIEALTNFFSNSNTLSNMEQAQNTQQEQQAQSQQLKQEQVPAPAQQPAQQQQSQQLAHDANANADVNAQALVPPATERSEEQQRQQLEQQHSAAIAAKDQEIANLRAELEALKKAPGASTSQVVEADKKDKPEEKPTAVEAFFSARQRAAALYDMLP